MCVVMFKASGDDCSIMAVFSTLIKPIFWNFFATTSFTINVFRYAYNSVDVRGDKDLLFLVTVLNTVTVALPSTLIYNEAVNCFYICCPDYFIKI